MSIDKFVQDGQDPRVTEKIHHKIADMLTHGESINYIAMQKKPAVTLLPDSITISNKRIFLCEFTKLGLATNFEIFSWKDIKDIAFKEEIFGSQVTVIPFTGENLSIDYIPKVQARKLYQLIKEALENGKNLVDETPVPIVKEKPQEVIEPKPEVKPVSINEMYKQQAELKKEEEIANEEPAKQEAKPTWQEPASTQTAPVVPEPKQTPVQDHTYTSPVSSSVPIYGTPIAQQHKEEEDEITIKLKKLKMLFDKQLITQAEYENKKTEILSQL